MSDPLSALVPSPPPLRASDFLDDPRPHVLIGCTGSVATIKLPLILQALSVHNVAIRVVLTDSATEFLQGQSAEQPTLASLLSIASVEAIYTDKDEWAVPWTRGAPILHIELRRWADIMVVAPLSANALAKMSIGLSDSLLLSVVRAWDTQGNIDPPRPGLSSALRSGTGQKPLLVAPSMNTAMWAHPVTSKQIAILEGEWNASSGGWIHVLRPMEKLLACGDTGAGAMKDWREIVSEIEVFMGLNTGMSRDQQASIRKTVDGGGREDA